MNIKNTMCRLSDLTQEQIDSLRAAMPEGKYDFFAGEDAIGATPKGNWGTWEIAELNRTIVSYDEMMKLLGKSMDFTKTDLIKLAEAKAVFVGRRDGSYRVYIDGLFSGESWVHTDDYFDNLKHCNAGELDVMAVYAADYHAPLIEQLKGIGLSKVWERAELTPAQKEMEILQTKMNELQEQMKVARAKL